MLTKTWSFLKMKETCVPIRDEFGFFQERSEVSFGCDIFVLYVILKFTLFLLEEIRKRKKSLKLKTATCQLNNSTHSITAGELDAAWLIFNDLLHFLPCGGQCDLWLNSYTRSVNASTIKLTTTITEIMMIMIYCCCGLGLTMEVSSNSCRKCSFFLLVRASTCSSNNFSFSCRSSRAVDSHRWSLRRLRLVSDQEASVDRTYT